MTRRVRGKRQVIDEGKRKIEKSRELRDWWLVE